MQNNAEMREQIAAVSQLTGLSQFVIEKDWFVTRAISIVSNMQHELYDLLFQGGTSLAKAHRVIERMSEDCDFRIRFKNPGRELSKEAKRRALRQFRHALVEALKKNGFMLDDTAVKVRNEGQFMGIRAYYPSMYPVTISIKPFLALEFFLAEVKEAPENKPVTTLIKRMLGDKVDQAVFPVNSVAIIETAAEKWVGLTRRVATSAYRTHYRDANLVRHLYDLYQINEFGRFSDKFSSLVSQVVLDDRRRYKNHNDNYYRDPVGEIMRAVDELNQSTEWHDNWDKFVEAMVFAQRKPTYNDVLKNLNEKTEIALKTLRAINFQEISQV